MQSAERSSPPPLKSGIWCQLRSEFVDQQPVYTSALALLPPQAAWSQIDEIRQLFDPAYPRWMPHINLIYCFLPEEFFPRAAAAMEGELNCHAPFDIRLEEFRVFDHGRTSTLVVVPTSESRSALFALRKGLQELFPSCVERNPRDFEPHLTLGRLGSGQEARRWMAELQIHWTPVVFPAKEVSLIARARDGPFGILRQLPLMGWGIRNSDWTWETMTEFSW